MPDPAPSVYVVGSINVDLIEFGFAQMHNAVGAILGSRGDMAAAAVAFEKAVTEDPNELSARYNLGLALHELGRHEAATGHFRLAVEAHPGYHEAWIGLARALRALGRSAESGEALRALMSLDPPAPPEIGRQSEDLLRTLPPEGERLEGGRAAIAP